MYLSIIGFLCSTIYNIDCNARYIVCVIYVMYLTTVLTRLLQGSMAQKMVNNSSLRLYNSCAKTFIKDNLFLQFKCK